MKNEEVVIKRDKVYTSYYARACRIVPDRRLVAISIGIPDGFNGEILRELNPSETLLHDYKSGKCSEEEYIERYRLNVLDKLNPIDIYNKVKGKVMLCYCGRDKFCHRKLVLDWLAQHLGEDVVGNEL